MPDRDIVKLTEALTVRTNAEIARKQVESEVKAMLSTIKEQIAELIEISIASTEANRQQIQSTKEMTRDIKASIETVALVMGAERATGTRPLDPATVQITNVGEAKSKRDVEIKGGL